MLQEFDETQKISVLQDLMCRPIQHYKKNARITKRRKCLLCRQLLPIVQTPVPPIFWTSIRQCLRVICT